NTSLIKIPFYVALRCITEHSNHYFPDLIFKAPHTSRIMFHTAIFGHKAYTNISLTKISFWKALYRIRIVSAFMFLLVSYL
ncbi:MAG: hypothetical protein IIT39_02845, partial [Clostridia bacterium]|nr:hypothetical protein [Clostridia bacterium]